MKKIATIILNRNLGGVTDSLCEHIIKYDSAETDIYVVDAGSDADKKSIYTTWSDESAVVKKYGLRYCRGMNYGLMKLRKEGKYNNYDYFFLLTNDTELEEKRTLEKMLSIMEQQLCIGILSPCSRRWGESMLLGEKSTKYFWYIHNNAYLLRREFIDDVCNTNEESTEMNFLFDGTNFRGYGCEHELIAKAYINNWAAAITTMVWSNENENHLIDKSSIIKTEAYEDNLNLYIEEGRRWMRNKYGFNSHWAMMQYVKSLYDKFFEFNPEYEDYKI